MFGWNNSIIICFYSLSFCFNNSRKWPINDLFHDDFVSLKKLSILIIIKTLKKSKYKLNGESIIDERTVFFSFVGVPKNLAFPNVFHLVDDFPRWVHFQELSRENRITRFGRISDNLVIPWCASKSRHSNHIDQMNTVKIMMMLQRLRTEYGMVRYGVCMFLWTCML